MPLNTANRRASMVGLAKPWVLVLPIPDPQSEGVGDRLQLAHCYNGLVSADPPLTWPALRAPMRLGFRLGL